MTILVMASFLYPILQRMDVQNKPQEKAIKEETTENCSNRFKESLSRFDRFYFSPLFIKDLRNIEERVAGRSQSFAVNTISDALATEMIEKESLMIEGQKLGRLNPREKDEEKVKETESFVIEK